jgi:hypothetical protein
MSKTKRHKASLARRMRSVSADMLSLSHDIEQFSPKNAKELEGASFMLIEWAEDILIEDNK